MFDSDVKLPRDQKVRDLTVMTLIFKSSTP